MMPPIRLCSRAGFTLLELLVVVGVIGLLAAIALPVLGSVRKNGEMTSEISAARQLMLAYVAYSADNDGQLLPGYGSFPAKDDKGIELHNPVANRYPWRLAPYLHYDLRIIYGKVGDSRLKLDRERDHAAFVYSVSVAPALGMNTVYVGGDYQMLNPDSPRVQSAYGQFCVTRMAQASHPASLIVFASAWFDNVGERIPGYFRVEPPKLGTARRWATKLLANASPDDTGHVDFRYDGRAVAAMLDGHVEVLDFDQMNDMRRWSNLAAETNDSGSPAGSFGPGSSSTSLSSSGLVTGGGTIDARPTDGNPVDAKSTDGNPAN